MIQLERGAVSSPDMSVEEALEAYDRCAEKTLQLMLAKNHDYGEVWRNMRVTSMTDLILSKIHRTKQIEDLQGETFVTRMDYVAPFFQEVAYALAVEKLLGITDDIPEKATVTRVLLMELNRISSHVVAVGTGGNELGGTTLMTIAFRCRENILKAFEMVSGLRMNHAFVRPGGLAQDIPAGAVEFIRSTLPNIKRDLGELEKLCMGNPILRGRMIGVGEIDLAGAMALSLTGPEIEDTEAFAGSESEAEAWRVACAAWWAANPEQGARPNIQGIPGA